MGQDYRLIGIVLAAGRSTRLRDVGIEQKALAKVWWNMEKLPAIIHQIRWMKQITKNVGVVVGWKGDDVIRVIGEANERVHILDDKKINGQWWAWKQVIDQTNEDRILSINVDDLHTMSDAVRIRDSLKNGNMLSVTSTKGIPPGRYARYDVRESRITGMINRTGVLGNRVGTGFYCFDSKDIMSMKIDESIRGEFGADDFVWNSIRKGMEIVSIDVRKWVDIGSMDGMLEVMSG